MGNGGHAGHGVAGPRGTEGRTAVAASHTDGFAVRAIDGAGGADPVPTTPTVLTATTPLVAGTTTWRTILPAGTDLVSVTYGGTTAGAPSTAFARSRVAPPSFATVLSAAAPTWGPIWMAAQTLALAIVRSGWTYWTLPHHALGALGASAASVQRLADHLFYQDHVTVSGPFAGVGPAGLWAWVHHPVGYYGTAAIPLQQAADHVWIAPVRYAVLLHHPVGALGPAAVAGQRAADVLWYRYDVGM